MREPRDYDRDRIERERFVAGERSDVDRDRNLDRDRDVEREHVERERYVDREPYDRGEMEYRGTRYGSTYGYSRLALTDMVRWGPIIAGFAAAVAVMILMSLLGAGIGATAVDPATGQATGTTFAAIWGALTLIVSFFVGGWLAARTSGIGGQMTAIINSSLVWAFTLLFLLFLTGFGIAGLLGALQSIALPAGTPGDALAGIGLDAAWWALLSLLLGLGAAIAGGLVGMHREPNPENR